MSCRPRASSYQLRVAVLAVALAFAIGGKVYTQARSAPEWMTQAADAQRTSWIAADPFISIDSVPRIQFLWKLKVDNESRQSNALTAPVAIGNLFTFRGFKSLVFVGGSSNNVYAIDYDFGTLFWKTHINYASGTHEFAGSPRCPGGMTAGPTRATSLTPATTLSFFGFARPPRPAAWLERSASTTNRRGGFTRAPGSGRSGAAKIITRRPPVGPARRWCSGAIYERLATDAWTENWLV